MYTLLHTVLLDEMFSTGSFYCTELCCMQLSLQTAHLNNALQRFTVPSLAHIFLMQHRLDAQCFATLLYYTIAIQLHYYSDYTSATLLHDCHTTATLLHYCHTSATLTAPRHYGYTTSTLRQKHITLLHTIPHHCRITAPHSLHYTLQYSAQIEPSSNLDHC